MAVDFVCGFECRVLVSGAAVTPDEDHWDSTAAAGASISTATVRSGTASLRNLNPAAGCNINKTIARKTVAGRIYVRFATLPSATTVILNVGGTNRGDIRVTSGGQVEVGWSTGTYVSVGSPLSTGVWYRLDFLADTTTGTASMKCRIDGGTEANGTLSVATANMTVVRVGFFAAVTGEVFFDDLILGDASGDYPFGPGSVERMKPTRDGTHSFTAADFGYDTAGADVAISATDVWDKLNDDDLSSTADLIRQKVIRTTGYVEVGFGSAPFSWDALAVNAVSSYHAAGTGADTFGLKMNDGGTLKTLTNEAGTGLSDVSQTTICFAEKVLTTAPSGGAWTAAKLGAVLVRGGYSDDVNAIPYWDGLMLEVAYGPPLLVPTTASLTLTTFAPTIAHKINGASPTALALTSFAPTVTSGAPVSVTPTTASLSTATFAPVLKTTIVGASPTALALTTFAPTIAHRITGASPTALALTSFAPVLGATIVGASPTALSLTTFAPTVAATANQTVTPGAASLTMTGFAPVLNETVTPDKVQGAEGNSLHLTQSGLPTITVSDNQLVTAATGWLATGVFTPVVALTVVGASPTALTTTTFAPVLKRAIVGATPTALVLTTFAPTVTASDHRTVTPTTRSVSLATVAPTVAASDHQLVTPTPVVLSVTTFEPTVAATARQMVVPGPLGLTVSGLPPDVESSNQIVVMPTPAQLTLTTYRPRLGAIGPRRRAEKAKFRPVKNSRLVPLPAELRLTPFPPDLFILDPHEVEALVMLGII